MKVESSDRAAAPFKCSIELLQNEPRILTKGLSKSPEEFASEADNVKAIYCAGYIRGMADSMAGLDLAELKQRTALLKSSS